MDAPCPECAFVSARTSASDAGADQWPQAVCSQLTAAQRRGFNATALLLQRCDNKQGSCHVTPIHGRCARARRAGPERDAARRSITATQSRLSRAAHRASLAPDGADRLRASPSWKSSRRSQPCQHGARALARSPFTLYSLGFDDHDVLARRAVTPLQLRRSDRQRYALRRARLACRPFCEVALLHAWHVAISNRLAARVLFAMPMPLAACIAGTPLWRMRRIARRPSGAADAALADEPGFWPDLVRFAAARDATRSPRRSCSAVSSSPRNSICARRAQHARRASRRACERAELQLRARMQLTSASRAVPRVRSELARATAPVPNLARMSSSAASRC